MAIGVNIVFEDNRLDRVERGVQSVQLLAEILPYVLAKYRVVPASASGGASPANRMSVRSVTDFQI